MFLKKFLLIILLAVYIIVFKNVINFSLISSGDFLKIGEVNLIPYIWDWNPAFGGLGGVTLGFSWLHFVITLPTFLLKPLGFSWVLIQKLAYIYPALILLILSPIVFFKKLFPKNNFYFLSSLVYALNTYILMLIGGGQIYIAFAYSLVPIVLYSFINLMQGNESKYLKNLKYSVFTGLLLTLQSMFDLRIAYITLFALGIYFLFNIKQLIFSKDLKEILVNISYIFIIPFAVSGLLHAFWILPLLIFHQSPIQSLGAVFTSTDAVRFFSFAKFENTISLFHPNWPENIFGKVGFMKPEFLILPILAFSSFLFVTKIKEQKTKIYILYFALLGLLGAFLAKGANEPFGEVYLWLFNYIPGFIMFRDPTKWYTLVAISYSILIPFTVWKIYEWLKSQTKFQISNFKFKINSKNETLSLQNLFLLFIVFCLLYLIQPALLGQLTGTFKSKTIPREYISLEKYISQDEFFFRTFWIPKTQRFGFYSSDHPVIPAQDFIKETNYSQILKNLGMKEMERILQESSVKYVIIPYDSEGEIFLKDRKYDNKLYENTVSEVRKIQWLNEIDGFGKIKVFEISNPKDHFWSHDKEIKIKYKYINPTKYSLDIQNAKKGDVIIFSESYDKNWIVHNLEFRIHSSEFNNRFNSFILPKNGNYVLEVYYTPQDWVNRGLVVSIASLVGLIAILIGFKLKKW